MDHLLLLLIKKLSLGITTKDAFFTAIPLRWIKKAFSRSLENARMHGHRQRHAGVEEPFQSLFTIKKWAKNFCFSMDSWRYLEKFLVVENCGQVRKKFSLVHRKNHSARLVHSSRTAAKHVHAHRYPRGISLIFIYFFNLSTAWSDLYYYDYFFIKLPKNNRGQVRSSSFFRIGMRVSCSVCRQGLRKKSGSSEIHAPLQGKVA